MTNFAKALETAVLALEALATAAQNLPTEQDGSEEAQTVEELQLAVNRLEGGAQDLLRKVSRG